MTRQAAGITQHAEVRGIITIVQEDRVRLIDALGRGYLFVIGKRVRHTPTALWALARDRRPVIIVYQGEPDLGAVAVAIRPEG